MSLDGKSITLPSPFPLLGNKHICVQQQAYKDITGHNDLLQGRNPVVAWRLTTSLFKSELTATRPLAPFTIVKENIGFKRRLSTNVKTSHLSIEDI